MNGTITNCTRHDFLRSNFLCLKTYLAQKYPETLVATLWNKWNSCKIKVHWREFSPYPPRGSKYQEKGAFLWPLRIFVPLSSMRISPFFVDLMSGASVFYRESFFFLFSSLCIFLVPLKRNGSRPKKCHFLKKWITRIKEYKRRINVVGFCCSIELFLSSHVQIILNYRDTAMKSEKSFQPLFA